MTTITPTDAASDRSTEVPEGGAPLSGSSPVLPVDSVVAPPMVDCAIPVLPPENGAHHVYSLYSEKFGSKPKVVVRHTHTYIYIYIYQVLTSPFTDMYYLWLMFYTRL